MKPLFLFPLLTLWALPLAAQEAGQAPSGADAEATPAPGAGDAQPPARDPHEGLPQRENEIPLEFSAVDVDGDGRLSLAEGLVAFPRSVIFVDLDEDGLLSREEVRETLPGVIFDDGRADDGVIGEPEYMAILEEITEVVEEEAGLESRGAEPASPPGAGTPG